LAKINFESLNLALVRDKFDADTFDENLNNEQHVEQNDESSSSESDEENIQPSFDAVPDAPIAIGGEGNEANVPPSAVTLCDVPTSSCIDWGSYYTDDELRALKLKLINLQEYLNHKDISDIGSTVCDSAIVDDEGNPRVQEEAIKRVNYLSRSTPSSSFLRLHCMSPSTILCGQVKKDVRYIIRCQISSCSWGVWLRRMKNEIHNWRMSRVKQPHTCGTSKVWNVHSQYLTKYLVCRIVSIMWADSDIMVATLIEVIHGLTTYQIHYGKAWRVKEHTLPLLWGDWHDLCLL
jgi:hypothetical protein